MKLGCTIVFVLGFVSMTVAQETNSAIHAIFKSYDRAVLSKITDLWYQSLDSSSPKTPQPSGKVIVEFRLFPDGHISDLTAKSSVVGESYVALCKQAVTNATPFESWSKEMRLVYTNDFRVMHFTFDYSSAKRPPNQGAEPRR